MKLKKSELSSSLFNLLYEKPLPLSAIELLLKNGADTEYYGFNRLTPIILCVVLNNIDCLKLLISFGANVDAINKNNGETALILAVRKKNIDAVKILLEAGADFNIESYEGYNALDYSRECSCFRDCDCPTLPFSIKFFLTQEQKKREKENGLTTN